MYLEIILGQIGHPYHGRINASNEFSPWFVLLCLLSLATHILSRSSLGLSVTRLLKSFLAERELKARICVIVASIMSLFARVAEDSTTCALASGHCDPYSVHLGLSPSGGNVFR